MMQAPSFGRLTRGAMSWNALLPLCGAVFLLTACSVESPTTVGMQAEGTLVHASADKAPGAPACRPDNKLAGRLLLSAADVPGTWWNLTREGLDDAGITDYKGFIDGAFGTTHATLADAIDAIIAAASAVDVNGNGYICAYRQRGTRAYLGDPHYADYLFVARDDYHGK